MDKEERRDELPERLENILRIMIKTTETKSYAGDNGIYEWIQAITFLNDYIQDMQK